MATASSIGYSSPAAPTKSLSAGGFGGGSAAPATSKTSLANSAIQQLLGGSSSSGMKSIDTNSQEYADKQKQNAANYYTQKGLAVPANLQSYVSGGGGGAATGGAAPPAAGGAGAGAGGATNVANANPASATAVAGLQSLSAPNAAGAQATQGLFDQANNKSGLYGQIDQNIADIRDRASLGIAGDQQMSRIRRGVSGSGIDESDKRALAKGQQNDINRMTTDATLGWEKERSNNLQAAGGMGLNTGAQQIGATTAAGSMGLAQGSQQLAQQQEARAMQNQMFTQQQVAEANARDSQMAGWNTILNLLS